ncbi:hypothetical protein MPER_02380 [Moniliophthora perniciosa FA553]|nr:hypothetical protein MPER_02380 [Moniliophthora perniciosa FA553]
MTRFLPLIDSSESSDELVRSLILLGPLVVSPSYSPLPEHSYVLEDKSNPQSVDQIISLLDSGVEKVILSLASAKEAINAIPKERLILLLDVANVSAVSDTLRNGVSGVLLKTPEIDLDLIASVSRVFLGSTIHVLSNSSNLPSMQTIRGLFASKANIILPTSQLTLSAACPTHLNVDRCFPCVHHIR